MSHADKTRTVGEELFVFVEQQTACVVDGNHLDADAAPLGKQLPRHNVGVMLHDGEDDLVALPHHLLAEGGGHQVDGFCGAPGKDNLLHLGGIDEAAHRLAGGLVQVGGLLREIVHAAVHVGIDIEILVAHGVEHTQRFLRGGGIVEIHQRTVIDLPRENGEGLSYF